MRLFDHFTVYQRSNRSTLSDAERKLAEYVAAYIVPILARRGSRSSSGIPMSWERCPPPSS
jgi:hypothetical protein